MKLFKYGWMVIIAGVVLSTCTHRQDKQPKHQQIIKQKPKVLSAPVMPDEKEFKVQSQPFDFNGLHLQFQYTVKEAPNAIDTERMVIVLDKRLFDLKRRLVVLDFPIASDDTNLPVKLSGINKAKYDQADFQDINFDGYKDIMELCDICGGVTHSYDDIYLFNAEAKNFEHWDEIMGWDVEINEQKRIVTSYLKEDNGFHYQEFGFGDQGVHLYEKDVSCTFLDQSRLKAQVTYDKFIQKESVVHRKKIIRLTEEDDPLVVIDRITK